MGDVVLLVRKPAVVKRPSDEVYTCTFCGRDEFRLWADGFVQCGHCTKGINKGFIYLTPTGIKGIVISTDPDKPIGETMKTLTQIQDQALQRMHEPRTSERREARNRSRALLHYAREAAKLGYTKEQINLQIRDLWDMYHLQEAAEAAAWNDSCKDQLRREGDWTDNGAVSGSGY